MPSLPSAPSDSVRAFVAVPLGPGLAEALGREQHRLKIQLPDRRLRWTRPDQWHLTLRFLGQVHAPALPDLVKVLQQTCASEAPMDLTLEGLGAFPSPGRPRVIWAGVTGQTERLAALRLKVVEATNRFGSPESPQGFHAHLTLGRVVASPPEARVLGTQWLRLSLPPLGAWRVDKVELMRSELRPDGARYTVLGGFRLGTGLQA